ncbi:hypothetical protein L195_g024849, partial [Trifolium pratense]
GNKLKNDDDVFKTEKTFGCNFYWKMCFVDPPSPRYCPLYRMYCTPNGGNAAPPQAQILP